MYTVMLFDVRRGQEGLVALTKEFYEKKSSGKFTYYQKKRGEISKNHKTDSEDIRNSGLIPFHEDEQGFQNETGLLFT